MGEPGFRSESPALAHGPPFGPDTDMPTTGGEGAAEEWASLGQRIQGAVKARDWATADQLVAAACRMRPACARGHMLRRRTMARLGCPARDIAEMLRCGVAMCATDADAAQLQGELRGLCAGSAGAAVGPEDPAPALPRARVRGADTAQLQAEFRGRRSGSAGAAVGLEDADAARLQGELRGLRAGSAGAAVGPEDPAPALPNARVRVKGVKLLPHEQDLVDSGRLADVTHAGASCIWLSAESSQLDDDTFTLVYRPMGDIEYAFLRQRGALPDTQPYQTIVEGREGRAYAEKYLRGHKSVDSSPTTVVEFAVPRALVERLFASQSKNEDGCISHGLGDKGGRGLPLFNASLVSGESRFKIVLVKRFNVKPPKARQR